MRFCRCERGADLCMRKREKQVLLILSDHEYRLLLYCLIDFRNKLIAENRYTDAVDELLLKFWK